MRLVSSVYYISIGLTVAVAKPLSSMIAIPSSTSSYSNWYSTTTFSSTSTIIPSASTIIISDINSADFSGTTTCWDGGFGTPSSPSSTTTTASGITAHTTY
ncbi:hypothetical protein HYPSUDRAFT_63911 [Hypholoma sublateritium FD-334 SS-4]|uniref:Uncharacterized protein n=1 Tax=Hypholoma sublateritium (strain FD-334 SS-4) TaxID=945553 RepID=A0A0D2P702_HYPSF|nr:hypothetical protein HYPSUDRAFT_63911 [Hypholoma sublateritium FD-334 SS-4]